MTSSDSRPAPLAGIRVLDVSSVLSGPLTTMLLSDLGAEVIKVEPPNAPDFTRHIGAESGGMTAYFYNTNRGKRSLVVDGRNERGQAILQQLADQADVLVQNMRPGKAAGVGLDPDDCLARNPSLIYTSISGFGADGPAAAEPVYDYVIQAEVGMVDVQRDPASGAADLTRHFIADKVTSHAALQAVVAALFARERDPERRGQHVEVSMHEANLAFVWPDAMMQHSLVDPPDVEHYYPGEFYRVYPTTDGAIVLMPMMGPIDGVCAAIGQPGWSSERYATLGPDNLHRFQEEIAAVVANWSTEQALKIFSSYDVPAGRVAQLADAHLHRQAQHRGSVPVHEVAPIGQVRSARPAWRFGSTPEVERVGAPVFGEHTRDILSELGYDQAAVAQLLGDGVVAEPPGA